MLFGKRDKITDNYDVVVIGSGLAGLTAANKLGKNGHKVLLLEAHNKLGGLATWFKRNEKGHIFDVSLHGFPIGMIKTCRKYWNKDIAESIVQLKDIRFVNPQFEIKTSFTKVDFTQKLIQEFNIPEKTVSDFFNEVNKMDFFDDLKMTNRDLFEKFFPGREDIIRFLMEPITYANGSTLDEPAITYGIVFSNFMSKGVYTFVGGTDILIAKMQEELLKNNVHIKMHAKVSKINIENQQVQSVVLEDGTKIKTKTVVSNSNLLSTVFDMVGEKEFSADYIEKSKQVRLNTSSCQVYMGIKDGETLPDIGDLIFMSKAPKFDTNLLLSKTISSRTFSVYYPKTRPGTNRYTIVASTNARYEDWNDLSPTEYEKDKQAMIEDTLVWLEELIPNVREKIDYLEAATPRTLERYTHHKKGSAFGTKFEGLDISMNMHKEIGGLFHSGSVGIIMSGWLGAANYGVITSNEVDGYLYKQG